MLNIALASYILDRNAFSPQSEVEPFLMKQNIVKQGLLIALNTTYLILLSVDIST